MTEIDPDTSDGYHTFAELYEHRHHLFIALLASQPLMRPWRSRLHADGSSIDPGWFIAGMDLPTGPISYHLPSSLWGLLDNHDIPTLRKARPWDGYTADEVVARLHYWIAEKIRE